MARLNIDRERIAAVCQTHHVRRLALFGSVLRKDFSPDSDVDVLVEFELGCIPGLFGLARLRWELAELFNREVDLRTPEDLSPYFREEVLSQAEVQYAA